MELKGGCYCGEVRYKIDGRPALTGQCHCRACQHFSGGAPNIFMLVEPDRFLYVAAPPASFRKAGLENAVTREFCSACGTQIVTRRPGLRQLVVKVGTLDDPSLIDGPSFAIFTGEMQRFHLIADGVAQYETLPPR